MVGRQWGAQLGLLGGLWLAGPAQAHIVEVWKELGPYSKDFPAREASAASALHGGAGMHDAPSDGAHAPRAPAPAAAGRRPGQEKRVRVLMNLSNQELLKVAQACAKEGVARSSLISVMVTWDVAWPVFKESWDACITDVVRHYPEAERLRQMGKEDFDVRIDFLQRHK